MKNPFHPARSRRHWRGKGCAVAGSMVAACLPLAAQQEADDAGAEPEALPSIAEEEADPELIEEEPIEYSNWVELSVGHVFVDGPESQFQQRQRIRGDTPFGGVSDLHWERFIGDNGFLKIDGRAVLEQEDYKVSLDYEHTDIGYVRAGFRQHRSWYDGVGGFHRGTDTWVPLDDRELELDRGEAWIEGGLTLPSWPVIRVRYSHLFRDGEKASTVWGRVDIPGGLRGVGASFYDIDEERDIFDVSAEHTVGNTDLGLGLRYEMSQTDNSLNLRQNPGAPLESFVTQKDQVDTDLFNVHAHSTTRLNDQLMFSTGYAFTTLDTDLGGSRIFGADYDSVYDPALARGTGFLGLTGGSQLDQHVIHLNAHYQPWDHWAIIPSIRLENQDVDGRALYTETPFLETTAAENERGYMDIAERLEIRYSGLTNWLFYARGDWLQGDGDLRERQVALATGTVELARDSDFTRLTQKYTAGANWYPLRHLNLSAQYYHKMRDNKYEDDVDSTANGAGGNRYPAFLRDQSFDTDDVNVRVTWRPLSTVSLISRYDYQWSTIDTRAAGFSELETAEMTSHILSETVSWTPRHWLYLQGGVNYVWDETRTPANDPPAPGGLVLDSENDYWQATFTTGLALGAKTDLQLEYTYSRADNYVDNSAAGQPFGAGFEEHTAFATLSRPITRSMIWKLRYGYFKSRDQATGGHTDYEAHLIYTSMTYRF